ncbi:hypothetical protein HHL19_06570 [Streptomyces sp. R302]|uniref:hypothetical protein n=1 Tax=unclassified Streptomyces TaxID=2593676 RepID=UPI00145EB52C|nr:MULTISPECIES: hypothetical protein [unclassified Streptomyces]NML53381.1 hypothetical protein [Streptomyces sp. R301]NML78335.1 hypothetical protein [Streptomyces sp. R302]
MTVMFGRTCGRAYVWAGVSLAALVGVSGCTGSPSYEIPETLCGRSIEPASLRPLLSDGRKVVGKEQDRDEKFVRCAIFVDKDAVLMISEYRDHHRFDIAEYKKERHVTEDPVDSKVPGESVIYDGGFVSMNPCPARGEKSNYILDITLTRSPEDGKRLRKELEAFAASYLPEGLKAMGCVK